MWNNAWTPAPPLPSAPPPTNANAVAVPQVDATGAYPQYTAAQFAAMTPDQQLALQQHWQQWQKYQEEYAKWHAQYGEQYNREMAAAMSGTVAPATPSYASFYQQQPPLPPPDNPQPPQAPPSQATKIAGQPQMYAQTPLAMANPMFAQPPPPPVTNTVTQQMTQPPPMHHPPMHQQAPVPQQLPIQTQQPPPSQQMLPPPHHPIVQPQQPSMLQQPPPIHQLPPVQQPPPMQQQPTQPPMHQQPPPIQHPPPVHHQLPPPPQQQQQPQQQQTRPYVNFNQPPPNFNNSQPRNQYDMNPNERPPFTDNKNSTTNSNSNFGNDGFNRGNFPSNFNQPPNDQMNRQNQHRPDNQWNNFGGPPPSADNRWNRGQNNEPNFNEGVNRGNQGPPPNFNSNDFNQGFGNNDQGPTNNNRFGPNNDRKSFDNRDQGGFGNRNDQQQRNQWRGNDNFQSDGGNNRWNNNSNNNFGSNNSNNRNEPSYRNESNMSNAPNSSNSGNFGNYGPSSHGGQQNQRGPDLDEESFDRQFRQWEQQFEDWKKANTNHPDREMYDRYEMEFERQRRRIMERREQMRRRKMEKMGIQEGIANSNQNQTRYPSSDLAPGTVSQAKDVPKPEILEQITDPKDHTPEENEENDIESENTAATEKKATENVKQLEEKNISETVSNKETKIPQKGSSSLDGKKGTRKSRFSAPKEAEVGKTVQQAEVISLDDDEDDDGGDDDGDGNENESSERQKTSTGPMSILFNKSDDIPGLDLVDEKVSNKANEDEKESPPKKKKLLDDVTVSQPKKIPSLFDVVVKNPNDPIQRDLSNNKSNRDKNIQSIGEKGLPANLPDITNTLKDPEFLKKISDALAKAQGKDQGDLKHNDNSRSNPGSFANSNLSFAEWQRSKSAGANNDRSKSEDGRSRSGFANEDNNDSMTKRFGDNDDKAFGNNFDGPNFSGPNNSNFGPGMGPNFGGQRNFNGPDGGSIGRNEGPGFGGPNNSNNRFGPDFGGPNNRFGPNNGPDFGGPNNIFGPNNGPDFGGPNNRFGPNGPNFGGPNDPNNRFGPNFGPNNRFGPGPGGNFFVPNSRFGPNNNGPNFGGPNDSNNRFGPNNNNNNNDNRFGGNDGRNFGGRQNDRSNFGGPNNGNGGRFGYRGDSNDNNSDRFGQPSNRQSFGGSNNRNNGDQNRSNSGRNNRDFDDTPNRKNDDEEHNQNRGGGRDGKKDADISNADRNSPGNMRNANNPFRRGGGPEAPIFDESELRNSSWMNGPAANARQDNFYRPAHVIDYQNTSMAPKVFDYGHQKSLSSSSTVCQMPNTSVTDIEFKPVQTFDYGHTSTPNLNSSLQSASPFNRSNQNDRNRKRNRNKNRKNLNTNTNTNTTKTAAEEQKNESEQSTAVLPNREQSNSVDNKNVEADANANEQQATEIKENNSNRANKDLEEISDTEDNLQDVAACDMIESELPVAPPPPIFTLISPHATNFMNIATGNGSGSIFPSTASANENIKKTSANHLQMSIPTIENHNTIAVDEILLNPGRITRPKKICIVIRGPPGSGKSHIARLIKEKENELGGANPRILSIDDYFLIENDYIEKCPKTGKSLPKKEILYEYEKEMEETYIQYLIKQFKKTLADNLYDFVIIDYNNNSLRTLNEFYCHSKDSGFMPYIVDLHCDLETCLSRNIHDRTEEDINEVLQTWNPTPLHYIKLDCSSLLENLVEMEDADDMVTEKPLDQQQESDPSYDVKKPQEADDAADKDSEENSNEAGDDATMSCGFLKSKWENDTTSENLARLDGTNKLMNKRKTATMEDFLQMDDWEPPKVSSNGKKRVRWADIEEKRAQDKMRAIGFVVGQTDWKRMMDPHAGNRALNRTKYIERVKKRR